MKYRIRSLTTLALGVTLVFAAATTCFGGDRVTLRLRDGRTITAQVDARTDQERLWLRFGSESVSLLRPVAWEVIETAQRDGQPITLEELRRMAGELAAGALAAGELVTDPFADERPAADEKTVPASDNRWPVPLTFFRHSAPVAWVEFDVYAANWDADVEVDGLIVHVRPLDGAGRLTAAGGTLRVELHGPPPHQRNTPRSAGQSLRRLGYWSSASHSAELTADGYVVKLPFQAYHPEFEDGAYPYGLVNVRLTLPGQGTFAASCDGVRLRPYAPLRDAQQRASGRRFLSHELTGRNNRQ